MSFAIAAILGKWLVPFLKKLKYGQTILDIGPKWHKGKQGTPTMGGLMFVISTVVTTVVCALLYSLLAEDEAFAQATLMMPRVLAGPVSYTHLSSTGRRLPKGRLSSN